MVAVTALVEAEVAGDGEPSGTGTGPGELLVGVALGEGVAEVEDPVGGSEQAGCLGTGDEPVTTMTMQPAIPVVPPTCGQIAEGR